MFVRQLLLGPMQNFVYLIGDEVSKECMVVDPAWDIPGIQTAVAEAGLTLKGALITHYHPDHCGGHLWGHDIPGIAELIATSPVPVYCDKHECAGIQLVTGLSKTDLKPLSSGDRVKIGQVEIEAIHTPGHTPGSQCFLVGQNLIAGDTLFLSGCGRVDLPGSDPDQMYESLTKLRKLPRDTVLYPGHNYGPKAQAPLSEVQKINPYLSIPSLEQWRSIMGGGQ